MFCHPVMRAIAAGCLAASVQAVPVSAAQEGNASGPGNLLDSLLGQWQSSVTEEDTEMGRYEQTGDVECEPHLMDRIVLCFELREKVSAEGPVFSRLPARMEIIEHWSVDSKAGNLVRRSLSPDGVGVTLTLKHREDGTYATEYTSELRPNLNGLVTFEGIGSNRITETWSFRNQDGDTVDTYRVIYTRKE